jgi:hypothetical protein
MVFIGLAALSGKAVNAVYAGDIIFMAASDTWGYRFYGAA